MKRPIRVSRMARNRLVYYTIFAFFAVAAWLYGGSMLYLALLAFACLPAISVLTTLVMLRGIHVTQSTESTQLMKNEQGQYIIHIHNRSPLMFSNIECRFIDDHFAVETRRQLQTIFARPFMRETHTVAFSVKYRGVYRLGLESLRLSDTLGLFRLKRKLKSTIKLTVWPQLTDIAHFPLANNILSQSNANLEIREEDYAVVSDVRKYEPTDPLKRVHWKLTAKKNEWMVKNFQTNALNKVTILMDTFAPSDNYEESLILEDKLIETALAVMRYCLRNAMPVEWVARMGVKREAANQGHFDALFHMAAELVFDGKPESASVLPMLNKCINETAGYINAVVFAVKLDGAFYERALNARRMGHSITVLFFSCGKADRESAEVLKRLEDSGVECVKVEVTP